jgi:hypothetical protein
MRISELFEAQNDVPEVSQTKVASAIYSLALKYFKAPEQIKNDAKRLMSSTDKFWSDSILDVVDRLEYFYKDAFGAGIYNDPEDELFSIIDYVVGDVIKVMKDYYSDSLKHLPGYNPQKKESIEIPRNVIKKEFAIVPNFTRALKVNDALVKESAPPEVSHTKVVSAIYSLALKYFKAPEQIKSNVKRLISSTDEFFSDSIDDVTDKLDEFYTDAFEGIYNDPEELFDTIEDAVNDVIEIMNGYYSNSQNHAPGYKPQKFEFHEHVEIPRNVIKKEFATVPDFTRMMKANDAALKAEKSRR